MPLIFVVLVTAVKQVSIERNMLKILFWDLCFSGIILKVHIF